MTQARQEKVKTTTLTVRIPVSYLRKIEKLPGKSRHDKLKRLVTQAVSTPSQQKTA